MKVLNRIILFPLCFASLPILALLGNNVKEVAMSVALRSLILSWVLTAVIWVLTYVFLREWYKSALVTSCVLILFFSYGHVYHMLRNLSDIGFALVRHRYLIIAYFIVFCVVMWLILKRKTNVINERRYLNLIGILLLIYPFFQIVHYVWIEGHSALAEVEHQSQESHLELPNDRDLPDIYYIILDGYTRQDSMVEDYFFDNFTFLDSLRKIGFYVGDCSRCNYCATTTSLVSSLNMDYIPQIKEDLKDYWVEDEMWLLIKNNRVRAGLEALGYKTIAFDSGTEWTRLRDADLYLGAYEDKLLIQAMNPFESLLIENSAGLLLREMYELSEMSHRREMFRSISFEYYGFELFARTQLYILDTIPKLPAIPGPKWVFVQF